MGYVTQRFIPGPRLIDGSDLDAMIDQINAGPGSGPTYYVNETIGNDGSNGLNPYQPLKTLDQALVLESAALARVGLASVGRNAVVAFWGSQHRTKTLAWNLPGTHLVGLCSGQRRGKRARIAVTGTVAFDKLVTVSKTGCEFANFGTFYGFDDTSALINWEDDGGRNFYDNVEFLGFGVDTSGNSTANRTGARAFKMGTAAVGETNWRRCVFGVDTAVRNVTNYTVEIASTPGAPRLTFEDCDFEAYLGASGGASSHMLIGASGIDRYLDIIKCRFSASGSSGGTAMAQCFNIALAAGGTVIIDQSTIGRGVTAWQTAPTANVVMNMTAPSAGGGKAITVA